MDYALEVKRAQLPPADNPGSHSADITAARGDAPNPHLSGSWQSMTPQAQPESSPAGKCTKSPLPAELSPDSTHLAQASCHPPSLVPVAGRS